MAAVLSADMDNTDKVDDFVHECRDLGLGVLPPDVNDSAYMFQARSPTTIRYGLGAIKGLGQSAIESIVAERDANGPYRDLADFCARIDLQKINRRAIDVSIRSGALDSLDPEGNRARMIHELPESLQAAEQFQRDQDSGQTDMFGRVQHTSGARPVTHQAIQPWNLLQSLQGERESLGLYLTGHPVQAHEQDLSCFTSCRLGEVAARVPAETQPGRRAGIQMTLAGAIQSIRRRGNRGTFVVIEDHTTRLELSLFDESWALYGDKLVKDEIIVVEGKVSANGFSGGCRMSVQKIRTLSEAKAEFARGVRISMRNADYGIVDALESAFLPYRLGSANVIIDFANARARARLVLGEDWKLKPCEELVAALGEVEGVGEVRLAY